MAKHLRLRSGPWLVLGALALSAIWGCPAPDYSDYSLRPGWYPNQEFHLETRYRSMAPMTERGDTTADPAADDLSDTVDLSDDFGESVYWRYQVIRNGFVPEAGDDFEEFASKGGKQSPLTVIKASLDPAMNVDNELATADPKIYLVIREDRLRLAGLVYFYTLEGERLSEAVTVDDDDMNKSHSLLSQSRLSVIPHFIPPFPIAPENREMTLENGERVSFTNSTESSVDVVYENAIDTTLIAETWVEGQPWATHSVTPTVESRLLSDSEVADLSRGSEGFRDNHEDPEDFDFVALLKAAVNIDAALNITDMIGSNLFEVREGYRPWAGSWWRQSEGALIFGHKTEHFGGTGAFPDSINLLDTISDLNSAAFKSHATDLQNLGDELRTLRKNGESSSDAYNTAREQYGEKQSAFVGELSDFYNAVRTAIDGGRITIDEGTIAAEANWNQDEDNAYPAFSLAVDGLSPLDKFALLQHLEGNTHGTNPWFAPAWEMLNHWSPAGSSWWGHCNGWAAAAMLTNEPRTDITVSVGEGDKHDIEITASDQKGLLSESFYSQLSSFYGARYNGDEDDDISDLSPRAVVQLVSIYIGQRGVPVVFDTSANEEVWNYPAWSYRLILNETTDGEASGRININTAGLEALMTLWGIDETRAQRVIDYREQHGAFQTPEEIIDVEGIGRGMYDRFAENVTVSQDTDLRTFDGRLEIRFATDGVGYEHIDTNIDAPLGFWKNYDFQLQAGPTGDIISSSWDSDDAHPDFAWVPYANTVDTGRSENKYLPWQDLRGYLPDALRQ